MKWLSKICFVFGWLVLTPLIAVGIAMATPLKDNDVATNIIVVPLLYFGGLLYDMGMPEEIVGTGGHVALATPLGLVLFEVLPAVALFAVAFCFRCANRKQAQRGDS